MIGKSLFFKYSFIVFQMSGVITSFSQANSNLLANGGFEMNRTIPSTWGEAHLLKYWETFANGKWSPLTYFYQSEYGGYVPTWKQGGKQAPHNGNGFIGLGLAFKDKQNVGSQYIESQLLDPLEKDSVYIISAFVSLADRLKYAIDYIPVAFSDKTILRNNGMPIYSSNVIKLKSSEPYLDNTAAWVKVSAKYKAIGGEQFFLMGGIEGNKMLGTEFKTKKLRFKFSLHYLLLNKLTFYFVDDISIQKQFQSISQPQVKIARMQDSTKEDREKIVIRDVLFKSNSYKLTDSIYIELNKIALELKCCDSCNLKISGYTDNTGTTESNMHLSLMRARVIYLYLMEKGIPAERMKYEGLGEICSLGSNNLMNELSKSRKVEIRIEKK